MNDIESTLVTIAEAKETVDHKAADNQPKLEAKVTQEYNGEVTRVMQRMSAIAREILALVEHEVPTMKKV